MNAEDLFDTNKTAHLAIDMPEGTFLQKHVVKNMQMYHLLK